MSHSVSQQQPVASPCISVCELSDEEVCLGCGRTLQDIAEWSGADEARRREIVEQARQRMINQSADSGFQGHPAI